MAMEPTMSCIHYGPTRHRLQTFILHQLSTPNLNPTLILNPKLQPYIDSKPRNLIQHQL